MIVAGTGHRPNKLGGYSSQAFDKLVFIAYDWLYANKPESVISGMALGWDTALAVATLNAEIPLTCAVPFRGQEKMWYQQSKDLYFDILHKAHDVHIIYEGGYAPFKMQIRNEWMVDHCTHVLAMWDGTPGGTNNCIRYATKENKPIINLYNHYLNLNK